MKYDVVYGIDPDIDKSGLSCVGKHLDTYMYDYSFPELMKQLWDIRKVLIDDLGKNVMVVVEAGWLNKKSSWHGSARDSRAKASKLGYDVGRNHEIGMLICEMLEAMGIPYKQKRPLKKIWKGPDGKITHDEIVAITGCQEKRSNPEKRDALLLAWDEAGLPMRIKGKI